MKKIITGLDIGTSKICAAILGIEQDKRPTIQGMGLADARGINKGFVSNLDKLVDSIQEAVQSAEDKAGLKAHNVITNISGASVTGNINEGVIPLSRRGREITKNDIERMLEMTKNISLSLEKDLLYSCPQEFVVDDNEGVENPLGLFGTKLKVKLYVITALATHIQNISKAVSYAGYELLDIVPTTIAVASGILSEDDLDHGAMLIDMGGGITEFAIFHRGLLRFFDSVNVGGMDLTARLSAHFKLPFGYAEAVKKKYGSVSKEDLKSEEKNIFDIDDRQITIKSAIMNNLLKERFDEIFYILKDRLKAAHPFADGIPTLVVTGGCALLNGSLESFENFFDRPVRLGRVNDITGDPSLILNPIYSSAISLAKYGLNRYKKSPSTLFKGKSFLIDTFYRLRDMLDEYF